MLAERLALGAETGRRVAVVVKVAADSVVFVLIVLVVLAYRDLVKMPCRRFLLHVLITIYVPEQVADRFVLRL